MGGLEVVLMRGWLGLALVFGAIPAALAGEYTIAPTEGWVQAVRAPAGAALARGNHRNGNVYLLVDRQWRVGDKGQSRYSHFVQKAMNATGVGEVSRIAIDFDPDYETVILHKVVVHRGGKVSDRLRRSRMSVIQRESELEYQVYSGTKTLNIFVEDVRPGDSVEYSYTVNGRNPVLAGHFSRYLDLRWQVPVGRVYYRVLWKASRPLHIAAHNTTIKPVVRKRDGAVEYSWRLEEVKGLMLDRHVPGWYNPFPEVQLSDMASWREVAAWARPLYRTTSDTPGQRAVIKDIESHAKGDEARVLAALHFVQNDIRYLGIEMGVRSHRPNAPDRVIEQRFGDCKDKSRLLASLLRGMHIDASPALVNTADGRGVKAGLPTPMAFNHAIVRVRLGGKSYWLDPTRSYQEGRLADLYQPNYDYALVVADDKAPLEAMAADVAVVQGEEVEETIDLRDAPHRAARYDILTHHDRHYADSLRARLSEASLKEIQQHYLNYTAQYFPGVQVAGEMQVTDEPRRNRVTVAEHYLVKGVWTRERDEPYMTAEFEPSLMNDHIHNVHSLVRSMPYAVAHPVRFRQKTRILLPRNSHFKDEFETVEDKAFRFTRRVTFTNGVLELEYAYESRRDHVDPADMQTYAKHVRQARDLAYFQIQMPIKKRSAKRENSVYETIWRQIERLEAVKPAPASSH